jgi:hypothetical protein
MLVGAGSLLIVVHGQRHLDLGAALASLTRSSLGILVAILFALVLATMITQAFGYEAIRILEGYWGPRADWLAGRLIARNKGRLERLEVAERALRQSAFAQARQRLVAGVQDEQALAKTQTLADILELITSDRNPRGYPVEQVNEAIAMGWRDSADPAQLRQLDDISQRLGRYPRPHRLLPTRLGNVLRSAEDSLDRADGGDVEGLVMRNYERIPQRLLAQHAHFRTRLDMYCTLVFVSILLALVSAAALWKFGAWHAPAIATVAGFVVLTWLSYRASIASAAGYGSVLRAIDAGITATIRG